MSDVLTADDKKEKEFPPLPKGAHVFSEKVIVRWWNEEAAKHIKTKDGISAFRFAAKVKGQDTKCFYLKQQDAGAVKLAPKSEIEDADGNIYVVTGSPSSAEDVLVYVVAK